MTEASEVALGLEVTKGLVAKFLMAIIGFVGTIIFARILGPLGFGGFYLVWTAVVLSKLPIDGFAGASMKRFSEGDSNRPAILGATIGVVVVVTVVLAVAATLVRGRLATYTGVPKAHIMFGLMFATVALFTPLQRMLSGTGKVSRTIWIDFVRSVLTTPLQLVFVLFSTGVAGMAYGLSLATALTIPLTYYTLDTKLSVPDWETLQSLWSFARFDTLAITLGRIYSRFDVLLLGALLTPAAAGQYQVALKLTVPAVFISEVAGDGLMARVSNLESKGESVSMDVSNTLSFASLLSIPLFFGAVVLAESVVVTIYGPEYSKAAPLLVGLALYRVFQTQANPLSQTISGLDKPEVNVWISAVTLALNVVLGVFLTLRIGSLGVVVATIVAEGLKYLFAAVYVRRSLPNVEIMSKLLMKQVFAGGVMAANVVVAHQWILIRSWVQLMALVGFGAVVYGGILTVISPRLRVTVTAVIQDAGVS